MQAILGKQIVQAYSGSPPEYSYWNGCSQGGRQGMMLAQRYPDAFDGIAAGAPAVYWSETMFNMFWSQVYMSSIDLYPFQCELEAITAAAVAFCDPLDGVEDGLVADSATCLSHFDVSTMVGIEVESCPQTNGSVDISKAATMVANATWRGLSDLTGAAIWPGFGVAADIAIGTSSTVCKDSYCTMDVSESYGIPANWLQLFVAKDAAFDLQTLKHDEFLRMLNASKQEYDSVIGTSDPDLTEFSQRGGKLISYHGLVCHHISKRAHLSSKTLTSAQSDQTVAPEASRLYYNQVSSVTPDIENFYRHFEVPGLAHCLGGSGGQPTSLFSQLRAWVENGTAPESSPITFTYKNVTHGNLLYPYGR